MKRSVMLSVLLVCAPGAWGPAAAQAPKAAPEILAGMEVAVAADGSVTAVEPDATLAEPIRAALVKRVSQWRFSVPTWQGHPVSTRKRLGLRLQPVPTAQGGFALKVLGTWGVPDPDPRYRMTPPEYPVRLRIRQVGGTFLYRMHVDEEGRIGEVQRLSPEGDLDRDRRQLDQAARAAMDGWMLRPVLADGVVVACDRLFPMRFQMGDDTSAQVSAKALKEGFDAGPMTCPDTTLETPVEGRLL